MPESSEKDGAEYRKTEKDIADRETAAQGLHRQSRRMGQPCAYNGHAHAGNQQAEHPGKVHETYGVGRKFREVPPCDGISEGSGQADGQAQGGGRAHGVGPIDRGPDQENHAEHGPGDARKARNQADEYADRKHGPFEPPGLGAGGGIEEQMNADQHDEEGEKAAQE